MDVTSRGYRIHYEVFAGDSPTIVLIHGVLQAAEDWIAYGYPDRLAPAHQVIAIDQLGFGESDKPHATDAYGLDHLVADVDAVLDVEDVHQAVLWGYSMGCNTAEAFARQHPERTAALILGGNLVGSSATDRANISGGSAVLLRSGGVRGFCAQVLPFVDERTLALFETRNDPIAAAAAAESMGRPHAGDAAPLPDATLNYAGAAEPWHPIGVAVAEANGVTFATVDHADHGQAFRGAEVVAPVVLGYLTEALSRLD